MDTVYLPTACRAEAACHHQLWDCNGHWTPHRNRKQAPKTIPRVGFDERKRHSKDTRFGWRTTISVSFPSSPL
jgi:hypothetical protein